VPPLAIAVHDVVMDQRGVVDQLDSRSRDNTVGWLRVGRSRAQQGEGGPH
jgi:hypothetical protein